MRGEVDGIGWMFNSVEYIDFNEDAFLNEAYVIMQLTNGGLSYSDLINMPFRRYEKLIKITKRVKDSLDG